MSTCNRRGALLSAHRTGIRVTQDYDAVLHTQDQLAGGDRMPTQLVQSSGCTTVLAEAPAMDCRPPFAALAPADLPKRGEPALDPLQQREAEPGSGMQLPPVDPSGSIPTWLFLPERRLEADPLRVRPADVRSARAMYHRTLQNQHSGGAVAGAGESGLPASQRVSATAAQAQQQEDGREQVSNAVQASKSCKGRGRLRGAMRAMSRTLRGQHGHDLSG